MTDLRPTKAGIRFTQASPFLQRDHTLKETSNQMMIPVNAEQEREDSPRAWDKGTGSFSRKPVYLPDGPKVLLDQVWGMWRPVAPEAGSFICF